MKTTPEHFSGVCYCRNEIFSVYWGYIGIFADILDTISSSKGIVSSKRGLVF